MVMSTPPNPIAATLPYDSGIQDGTQTAYGCTIHVLIPHHDTQGNPVNDADDVADYMNETLRGLFLDWAYTNSDGSRMTPMTVCEPYVEGTFMEDL